MMSTVLCEFCEVAYASYCARHSHVIFSHGGIGRGLYGAAVFILK